MERTVILQCNGAADNKCVSAFQDERYGKGKRLHNVGAKEEIVRKGKPETARCTVCANVKKL